MGEKRTYGSGSMRQRANGRWEATLSLGIVNGKRLRKSIYGKSRDDVRRKLREALAERERGTLVQTSRLTVGAYTAIWLRDVVGLLPRKTQMDYRSALKHVPVEIQGTKLQTLTPSQVQGMYADWQRSHLARNTVRRMMVVFQAMLNHAVDMEIIPRSPARRIKLPVYTPSRRPTLTVDEMTRVLAAARDDPWEAYYWLMLTTGARPIELLRLRWNDVDWNRGLIAIRRSKTQAGVREVPLSQAVLAKLRAHRDRQIPEIAVLFPSYQKTEAGRLDTVRRHWYALLARAGVPRVWLYTGGRHTAATTYRNLGVGLDTVKDMLGHSSISITADVYTHSDLERQREAAERLASLLTVAAPDLAPDKGS